MEKSEREDVYSRDEYYWGTEPSTLAERTADMLPEQLDGHRLIDLGAGEGRDAVFFAKRGADVTAVEISPAGLEKARRLAANHGVSITTVHADANELRFTESFDIVFSSGAVQFIRPDIRARQFARFKEATTPGGLHAIFAFVDHPDVPPAPDTTDDQYLFERDELQSYYETWETVASEEIIFADDSGGVPHKHAARVHFARAPESH